MNSVQGTPEDFDSHMKRQSVVTCEECHIGKHKADEDGLVRLNLTGENICEECRRNWTLRAIVEYVKGTEAIAEAEYLESVITQLYPQSPPKIGNKKITTKRSNLR